MTDTSRSGLAQRCGSHADSIKDELLRKENNILGKNLGRLGLEAEEQEKSMKQAVVVINLSQTLVWIIVGNNLKQPTVTSHRFPPFSRFPQTHPLFPDVQQPS